MGTCVSSSTRIKLVTVRTIVKDQFGSRELLLLMPIQPAILPTIKYTKKEESEHLKMNHPMTIAVLLKKPTTISEQSDWEG